MSDRLPREDKLSEAETLRKIRLTQLIQDLQKEQQIAFYMGTYYSTNIPRHAGIFAELPPENIPEGYCGSLCCLAGLAYVKHAERPERLHSDQYFEWAKDWLGLTQAEAKALFTPGEVMVFKVARHYSKSTAVRVLRRLRDEGVVDWPRAMKEEIAAGTTEGR